MKKSFILLPLAVAVLSGCLPGGGKKKSSSGATSTPTASTSGGGGGGGQPTVAPEPADLPTAHEDSFDTSAGEHTIEYDFINNYSDYSGSGNPAFPYVDADTGITGGYLDGMAIMSNGVYCTSYQDKGFIQLKNKDRTSMPLAFLGNCVSLGTILKVEIGAPDASVTVSTSQKYDITLSKSLEQAPSSSGTSFTTPLTNASVTASESDGYSFFRISTLVSGKNGHIGTIKVTYKF